MDRKLHLCSNFGICQLFSLIEHPQTNKLVKAKNKVILTSLKKKLDKAKGRLAKFLLEIL